MAQKMAGRFNALLSIFIVSMVMIFLQLVNLQIIKGEEYNDQSQRRLLKERKIIAPRGNILDRNKIPIAVNRPSFSIEILKTDISSEQLNLEILRLVYILEKNNDYYVSSLNKYITFNPIEFGSSLKTSQSIKKWKMEIGIRKIDLNKFSTPQSVYKYLKDKFKINNSYKEEDAYKIMRVRYEMFILGYSSLNHFSIAKDVTKESVAEIDERSFEFPGVSVSTEPKRKYIDGDVSSHVIGYVGNISSSEYEKLKDSGYDINDTIGKSGVEIQQETNLKGVDGIKKVEFDIDGRRTEEIIADSAVPGNDIVLTIDTKLQKIAADSLKKNIEQIKSQRDNRTNFGDAFAGSIVALDVNTGAVLADVSYPSYDPSVYSAPSYDEEAQKIKYKLITDSENAPMLNRTIQGLYIPGSTYKPLTAIAALEEGTITPETIIRDNGVENIGGWTFKCLEYRLGLGAHGNLNLERALATSCNIFFHILGSRTTIDKLDKWAKIFGLGELTGIDIPGEKKGLRANKETKKKLRNDIWRPADTAQTAIGQFDNIFTPLQITSYISTIANGGKKYKPYVVKEITKYDGSTVSITKPQYTPIDLKPETVAAVKKGMVAVTNSIDGTAVKVFKDFPFKVAGKTGTPETGAESRHSSNAIFTCYAPADNPQIAVSVVIERGAWGANAAPVARDVLAEYFDLNNKNFVEPTVQSNVVKLVP